VVSRPLGIRVRVVLLVGLVVTGLSWLVLRLALNGGADLPDPSWIGIVILVAIALGVVVAGRPVKRLVAGTATRTVHPLYAARVLAMSQAAALGGAAVFGWYAAQLLLALPDSDVSSQQQRILLLGGLALAAAGLSAVGLLVQRWCRLDEDDDRIDPADPRFDDDSRYR
jgi:signal transduction histidine kinase